MALINLEIQGDYLLVSNRKSSVLLPLNPRCCILRSQLTCSRDFLDKLEIVHSPIYLFGSNVRPRKFPKSQTTFFAAFLGIPLDQLELVYLGPQPRDLPVNRPPETAQGGGPIHTSFVDSGPYSLVTKGSFEDVNAPLLPINKWADIPRFRPNIVISDTIRPWDEDDWKEISVGNGHRFYVVSRIPRCEVIKSSPYRLTLW
jgi:uncharacterized protein YcbX